MQPATKGDWKTRSMSDISTTCSWPMSFDTSDFEQIAKGLIPKQMEDKWFIYLDELNLYFHRSWTGDCIFIVRFEEKSTTYRVVEVTMNRDPEQYGGTDDEFELLLLEFLIKTLLLNQQAPFPVPKEKEGVTAGLFQHHVAGSLHREVAYKPSSKPWWMFWG